MPCKGYEGHRCVDPAFKKLLAQVRAALIKKGWSSSQDKLDRVARDKANRKWNTICGRKNRAYFTSIGISTKLFRLNLA